MNETSVVPLSRQMADTVEIAFLSIIIVLGTLLNLIIFMQLVRHSRTPTATTSFSSGPYQINSFTLFKLNLCVTDFAILLVHALGKVVWLSTYEWPFGTVSCKIYQFLSAFTYYSNSNVVVAIGIDRLKVVYISHIQGATSVRRVRCMLLFAWMLAAICSTPQLYVWTTIEISLSWIQCSTVWEIAAFEGRSSPSFERLQMIYELTHQAFVFWFPSLLLFISYLLIMIRLLHYTFRPTHDERKQRPRSASSLLRTRMTSFEKSQLISEELAASPICCKGPFFHLLRFGEKHCENSGFFFDDSVRSRCPSNSTEQNRSRAATIVSCSGSTLRRSRATPLWRRQLRSRMFLTSLTVVAAHIALWLPYNIISTSRFINFEFYTWASEHGGRLLEDLIIVNSLINPLIYGCGA